MRSKNYQPLAAGLLENYESDTLVEADENTDPEVGDDATNRQEVSSTAKPKCRTRAAAVKQSASTVAAKVEAAKTAKLEAEKMKKRKRRTSPPAVETLVIPSPSTREVESDEEDVATDDPPVIEDRTVRRSLSPAAKRQRELEQKTMEDDLCQGMEVQRAAAGAQARMPVLIKARPFRPKLRAPATVWYGRRTEDLLLIALAEFCIVFDDGSCRSDVRPQRDLGAQASPSRTRSPDHEVGAQMLVDNARMTTPSPVADVGTHGSIGDVGASSSPPVIDVDPINTVPCTSYQDLIGDLIQIEQSLKNLETSSTLRRVCHRQDRR
jgi:hypothetical protein